MIEWRHIIKLYNEVRTTKRSAALATVVQIQGSSYRSTGSRMLILDDGRWAGTISGGCLEKDACIQASMVMNFRAPKLVTYDSSRESDQAFMARLGCNGIIDVLFEPLENEDPKIKMLETFLEWQNAGAVATVYQSEDNEVVKMGSRVICQEDGSLISDELVPELKTEIHADLLKSISRARSFNKTYQVGDNSIKVLIELIQPTIHLYVFGSGYDVHPLLKQATDLGWKSTICIQQEAKAKAQFYPNAITVAFCPYKDINEHFTFKPYSAAIVMCHNYEHDLCILEQLVQTELRFIGLLGPKKRAQEMMEEMRLKGINIPKSGHSAIHAPVGLDIGAEGPVEIALSIVTEILADFKGHEGGFLKERQGPIHERGDKNGLVFRNHYV